MSGIQDALFRKDYDCTKPAVPVTELCDADAQERSEKSYQSDTLREIDHRRLKGGTVLWIIPKSPTIGDRPAKQRTARLKSTRVGRRKPPDTRKRPEAGRVPALGRESGVELPRQEKEESLAEQIRRFQERADLRECLLPGMVGGVSQKACEGWQRQAALRNSRMLAKIKLQPCKECPYALRPAAARV